MRIVDFGCTTTGIFIVTPSLGGLPTKAEESPLPMRQTCPRRTPTRSKFTRQWLELPISATLSSIILSSKKFGLAFQLPSVKFQQCQRVLRSSLKSSKDESIVKIWKNTNCGTNIQYDVYKNTKQILKSIRTEHTERLKTELPSQGFIISFFLVHSLINLNSLWSRAQSKLPANIFNFTIKI